LKASVVVLTKNGGALVREGLRAVCSQRLDAPFEILVIDSASHDGTAEVARANPQVRFMALPAGEFQHGRTRNLAMRETRGELVAFLTQDAVPEGDAWLAELVAFMDAHPGVAGAFGHQLPHHHADPLEAWEVRCHFETFRGQPVEFRQPGDGAPMGQEQAARLHYFSNVNSCIRRAAWERIPFPEVDFGEDQAWARAVQAAGLATGYAERAVVRHSHDYGVVELFRRRYDEARFMKRQFGYPLVASWQAARAMAAAHASHFRVQLGGRPGEFDPMATLRANARAWASTLGRFAGTRLAENQGRLHSWFSLFEKQRRA
jgi:rhamnosyltransferase